MSQSDFIQYKKLHTELKIDTIPKVFTSQKFTLYKQFTAENIIDVSENTILQKQNYNRLIPPNKKIIFGIETNILDSSFSSMLCRK